MPLLLLLMRMLLCASLVLNGTGQAPASAGTGAPAHAHSGSHGQAAAAHQHPRMAATHCHDAAAMADTAHGHAAADACPPADSDCCKHGDCRQACHPQHSPAAHLGLSLATAMVVSQDASRPLATIHDAPVPLRLIRPPIA